MLMRGLREREDFTADNFITSYLGLKEERQKSKR